MTIEEAIRQILDSVLENKAIYLLYEDRVALYKALNVMRKYQKIEQILKDIPYGGDATVRRIQEVVEDGND